MPYTKGPYADHSSLPVPPRPKVGSARWIDFSARRYELDATTGGFRRMPPTVQRVVILAGRVLQTMGPFNTLQERNRIRTEIRNALSIMTKQPAPEIEIKEILVATEFPGTANAQLTFRDLTRNTGIDDQVQLP